MENQFIKIEHLCKYFGNTHANDDINLEIKRGVIYGLAGENGSGKSTLSSIISGIQGFDSGTIYLNGKEYRPQSPLEANENKVAMVVQELGVVPSLSGAINMYMGKTKEFTQMGVVSLNKINKQAHAELEKWELGDIPVESAASELTMEQRKILELARALSNDPDLLILDEITQSLSHDTRQIVYRLVKRFKEANKSILMISHDLEETIELCDEIIILRDGKIVETVSTKEITLDSLKTKMIGREVSNDYYREDHSPQYGDEVILQVRNLTVEGGTLQDISFDLHEGEILAICGLSDAGIHTLGSAVFGTEENRKGKILYRNEKELKKPGDVIKVGGAYLSKNRDEEGLMLEATIKENMYIPSVNELAGKKGYMSLGDIDRLAQKAYEDFEVKATGVNQTIGRLSGGNKQKINLSRWLVKDLTFAILDCPTRGVDIGVKAYIYHVLKEAKKNKLSIILISDELPEALGMADRILILKDGKTAGMLERGSEFTENNIIEVMI